MGKTKTAFIGETISEPAREKKAKITKSDSDEVTRVPGKEDGERVKIVSRAEEDGDKPASRLAPRERRKSRARGKKYQDAIALVDRKKLYPLSEALELLGSLSYTKFDATVELHIVVKKIGLSAKVSFPHSTGKTKVVELADDNTIKKLEKGEVDFDVLLSTADMMPKLVPFARVLGPRGLMPNPKSGTLMKDAKDAKSFSANNVLLKTEKKSPVIHTTIGKVSQPKKELAANAEAVFAALAPRQTTRAYLVTTMGPSVKVDIAS